MREAYSRELDRNKGKKGYRHKKAQGMARHRIAVKAAKRRGGTRPPGQTWPSAHIRRNLRLKACDMWLDGTRTSWGDPDYDARYFGSQLLMKCPMFGRVTQTQEGQKAKADYERWGDRIDDLTILPWRSYEKRYRRIEVLPKIGAEFGFIAPVLIMLLHIALAFWGTIVVVRLKRGVYRAVAGWVLAILVLPWIDVLIGPIFASSDAKPWFVLPDYLPFLNEQPELLLASLIQSCVLVAAPRYGRNREAQSPSAFPGSSDGRGETAKRPHEQQTVVVQ